MFYFSNFTMFFIPTSYLHRGVVSLFIFLEKTKQKIVVALESRCFQGRSPRQAHIRVINEKGDNLLCR
jgi:hypothetical protein